MDFNISANSNFFLTYDKAGNEINNISSPVDVQFMKCFEINNIPFLFGAQTTHPESTLIPFISETDSTSLISIYSDSTVYGLAHMTYIEVDGNDIYFLGDDTGDASGTISIFKYVLKSDTEEDNKKSTIKKKK